VTASISGGHPLFADVRIGDEIAVREYGPLTLVDTVRWAGVQENPEPLHWDREHARSHSGMRTIIASGGYRQAMLARTLTDWVGPDGMLRRMSVRHLAPTYEGDRMRIAARVVERSQDDADPWVVCEVDGRNQTGDAILSGRCTLRLATERRA
jgi:acyl dehydratase